ncbi:alpha/beta hydrolase fold protein [Kribbella flavida DSM 17836]|uniref:Alpha/beta hydrolase fold protein n=1 Tax=Kribbella flavida (strain DSM 17836 / JCM 10339 / NBRC 14399) TaxID=479435 RepID=D2PUE7_KRIFD|nr:alpha/beta hydrolase [Kribbella flavida]ADB35198.1 alpha/beta hydrolase fold protein [Kribbella flavida DSM 17836]
MNVHHRTVTVDGHQIFYREAGPADAPVLLLLHGFPTSSHMFRDLIPRLADKYHLIAPDHLGFGSSAMPAADEFAYSFAALADLTTKFTEQLGLSAYAIYVQDYGAPIGWRMALAHPERIRAVITQNGNAYEDGIVEQVWQNIRAYDADPSPETAAAALEAASEDAVKWQYLHGVPDESLVSPDTWQHDLSLLSRPGAGQVQLDLMRTYLTNFAMYPQFQEYFRTSQVPLLAAWGENDEIFPPAGAKAFRRDLPDAEIHLLPTGHFALETHAAEIAALVDGFLTRVL